jgi:hypothetical protein
MINDPVAVHRELEDTDATTDRYDEQGRLGP